MTFSIDGTSVHIWQSDSIGGRTPSSYTQTTETRQSG